MKKTFKLAAIAFLGVALLSLSSCIKGNDGEEVQFKQIGTLEKTTIMNAIVGNYTGKLHFPKSLDEANKTDSVVLNWSVTSDTTIVIPEFPVKVLVNLVRGDKDFKDALAAADPVNVEMKLQMPAYMVENYFNSGYYLLSPLAKGDVDVNLAGKPAKLTFASSIYVGSISYRSVQQLFEYSKAIEKNRTRLLVKQITFNNTPHEINAPVVLLGKKM